MHLETQAHGPVMALTMTTPRFTGAVAREVRAEALAAIGDGHKVYLVDLSHVTQIDSSGLGALVGAMKHVGRYGRLELCGLLPRVRKVLRLTRLDGVFTIHRDLNAGLDAHFAPRARAV